VYKGVAVVARHGSGVVFRWVLDGGAVSTGAGMWRPDGSLVAGAGGGGVIAYRLSEDGKTLTGQWIGGTGTINTEKLTFLKRRD